MSNWGQVKKERATLIGGWKCETCGCELTPQTAMGHHVHYKSRGGPDTVDNCRLHCLICELWQHENDNYYRPQKQRYHQRARSRR